MIEIKWLGRGGQGAFTAARLLGEAVSMHEDKYAMAFPSFGPERRGAPVQAFTKIDNIKITDRSEIKSCDYLIVLDETLVQKSLFEELKPNGVVLVNSRNSQKYEDNKNKVIAIDATLIAMEILNKPVSNTAMMGALLAVSNIIPIESLIDTIRQELNSSIAEKNVEIVKKAYALSGGKLS